MSLSRREFLGTSAATASAVGLMSFSNAVQAGTMPDKQGMNFTVSANGKDIGKHSIKFAQQDGQLHVKSSVDVGVRLAGFTAFYYKLLSHEVWEGGKLVQLKSRSDMNGKQSKLLAVAKSDGLLIQNNDKRFMASAHVKPTSYWNPQILNELIITF